MSGFAPNGYFQVHFAVRAVIKMAGEGHVRPDLLIDSANDVLDVLGTNLAANKLNAVAGLPNGDLVPIDSKFWRAEGAREALEKGYFVPANPSREELHGATVLLNVNGG